MSLQALCIQMGEVCTVVSTTAAELPPEPTPLPDDPKLEAKVCPLSSGQSCSLCSITSSLSSWQGSRICGCIDMRT